MVNEIQYILVAKNCRNCNILVDRKLDKCPKCEGELDDVVEKYGR
jgi:RNA polymerase subunit RPABC4/transcription elongation factor Spt4